MCFAGSSPSLNFLAWELLQADIDNLFELIIFRLLFAAIAFEGHWVCKKVQKRIVQSSELKRFSYIHRLVDKKNNQSQDN